VQRNAMVRGATLGPGEPSNAATSDILDDESLDDGVRPNLGHGIAYGCAPISSADTEAGTPPSSSGQAIFATLFPSWRGRQAPHAAGTSGNYLRALQG
jgi:hypothetical protein